MGPLRDSTGERRSNPVATENPVAGTPRLDHRRSLARGKCTTRFQPRDAEPPGLPLLSTHTTNRCRLLNATQTSELNACARHTGGGDVVEWDALGPMAETGSLADF